MVIDSNKRSRIYQLAILRLKVTLHAKANTEKDVKKVIITKIGKKILKSTQRVINTGCIHKIYIIIYEGHFFIMPSFGDFTSNN